MNFESPTFVSLVLITIYVLLLVATALTVWSVLRGLRLQGKDGGRENGVPARSIALLTAALLVVTMGATWLLGSTKPMVVNGKAFADTFWLRTSDMLITTPIVLIVMLAIVSIVGALRKK